jgi:catecholate siderophore receptor
VSAKVSRSGIRTVVREALRTGAWIGAASLAAGAVQAQQPGSTRSDQEASGEVIDVFGERLEHGLGTRYTAPLLETPQTITLVPSEIIEQQNLLTMRDVLSTLPGITFTAGEGGGGYGDGVNLRGYTASSDISSDGVRDSAQYSRTDHFNLEQLELVSGANSVYTGAGSVGGSINLVTKAPTGRSGTVLRVAGGGESYGRLTLDSESQLGDVTDVRLNLMAHQNDVPGRDVERYERWGIAPSVAFGNGTDTRLTLSYLHQEDDNIPQYGVPYALGAFNDGPLPGVPSSAYYGYENIDRQEITVDGFTATVEHDFTDNFGVRNLLRWQEVQQYLVVDPPQGTWCIESGINPWTGLPCVAPAAPGTYQPSGPRGNLRDTTNDILINQTDFTAEFATGAIQHTLVTGFSFSNETYHRDGGNVLRNPDGTVPGPLPAMSIADPYHVYEGPVNTVITQIADGDVANRAAYVFDRVQLSERFEINGGLRVERNDGSSTVGNITPPLPGAVVQSPVAENTDTLSSYRIGFMYKPSANSSIYIAQGNSETPSQSTVNGSCNIETTCNVDPEEGETVEIGGKWDFNEVLTLTAAVFDNERSNFKVASNEPGVPEQQLDGTSSVRGIALGAAGRMGEKWSVFANYTFLDSEVEQSISDFLIGTGQVDLLAGDPLPNTPEHSASVWTTFQPTANLAFGYGVTYQGEYTFVRFPGSAELYYTPTYLVHRAMATFTFSESLALQVNIDNLTDEEYYERIRNNAGNGWATPGAARNAVVSLNWRL